jgi:hypothetical protein
LSVSGVACVIAKVMVEYTFRFSWLITQTMHTKSFYTQQHCYVSLKLYTLAGFEPGSSHCLGGCDVHCAQPPGQGRVFLPPSKCLNLGVFTKKTIFKLHRVARHCPTQLGWILIWLDAVIRHIVTQILSFVLIPIILHKTTISITNVFILYNRANPIIVMYINLQS